MDRSGTFRSPLRLSIPSGLSKSLPPPSTSYEEFQAARIEKMTMVTNDIKAKKEQELRELQTKLHELILQINTAQSTLAVEERDFLNEKESLLTELKKIKVNAEAKSAESRMSHLSQMEQLQNEHEEALKRFAESIKEYEPPEDEETDDPKINSMKEQLKRSQAKVIGLRNEAMNNKESPNANLYNNRIAELEAQKRELLQCLKEEENTNKKRVTELTLLLDEQDTTFQEEIQSIQQDMKTREEKYQNELNRLFMDLDHAQETRQAAVAKRKEKIAEIQSQIEEVETQFKEKIRQANRVAEKLKTALINANIRKTQQLEIERKRSEEQHVYLKEQNMIQYRITRLKAELDKAKKESMILRKELSSKIGPRRTASLFN